MTDNEKKMLQAQHRLDEAKARNRDKERKARNHRLIQEGAILEATLPYTKNMTLDEIRDYLFKLSQVPLSGTHRTGGSH